MTVAVIGKNVRQMFGSIAVRYDLTNSVLSLGIHHLWRSRLLSKAVAYRQPVALDLCTGTGDLLPLIKNRFVTTIGADFCLPMLKVGKKKKTYNLKGVELLQADALQLPLVDESVDLVTVAFGVRNLESLPQGLSEIRRILRPGGKLLVLEFGQPPGLVFGALYRFYSRYLMPLIGGAITGNREAYSYLPKTAQSFPCGSNFLAQLRAAGFEELSSEALSFGIAYIYHGQK